MNSYKRHVYKTKNPPKPKRPTFLANWFRSEQVASDEYCAPIDIQVFKDPNTFPIQVSDILYTDLSFTNPLNLGGATANYLIDTSQTQNPTISIKNITVDGSGVVTNISTGDCEVYIDINITNAETSRVVACSSTRRTVKVREEDIDGITGEINEGAQLYSAPNVVLDTSFISFTNGVDNFIGIDLVPTGSVGDASVYSMKINNTGIVTEPVLCGI